MCMCLCVCLCVTSEHSMTLDTLLYSTGKKVVQLEYECYPEMAEKEMHKICSVIREKWSVKGIAILHRLG